MAEECVGSVCGDNRFDVIAKAKKALLESTNIETSEDEMKCLDTFLFRCWQMGWLEKYNNTQFAVTDEVRLAAIDYFKFQEEPTRSRLIENAMLGAEWRFLHKDLPFGAVNPAKDARYPFNPDGGREYSVCLACCAFEYGANLAYEIIRKKT